MRRPKKPPRGQKIEKFLRVVPSPKNFSIRLKKFWPQNKKRRKTTRHTLYSAMSSIPSGGPPGGTHTQELWYSLRGIDAGLQSVSRKDKCPCDACCARFSTPIFVGFLLVFCKPTKFFRRILKFLGEKTHVANFFERRDRGEKEGKQKICIRERGE